MQRAIQHFVDAIAGELVQIFPVLTRTGYKFDGWYANSADANPNPAKNTAAPSSRPTMFH